MNIPALCGQLSQLDELSLFPGISFQKMFYPLIAVHSSGIYLFFDHSALPQRKSPLNDAVCALQQMLSVPRLKMHIYCLLSDGSWVYINPQTDDPARIADVFAHILSEVNSGSHVIDQHSADYYSQKLMFGTTSGRVRKMPDGETYLKKGGHWYPASSEDPDDVYMKTCLYGVFGWFQYHRGKRINSLIYALTCGLFGVGWLMDLLSFLLNSARDEEGKYYQPLSDRKRFWLLFLCCLLACIALLAAYQFLLSILNRGFVSVLVKAAGSLNPGRQFPVPG